MSRVCVVGSSYCVPYMVELAVGRRVMPNPDNTIFVSDNNHRTVFKAVDTSSDLHLKRVLLDAAGTPILTFREKVRSLHHQWRVYKGNSEDDKDLIFTAKQSSMLGSKRELNVFLASNKHEEKCDFKVGSSSNLFYVGSSHTNIMAEARDYTVIVHPNVDQAFIVSLIVIQDGINQQRQAKAEAIMTVAGSAVGS